jgi:hypothetical protein
MASRRGAVAPLLALPAASHASAFESRFENDAVDALPYADVLPEGWRDAAEALVREEARATARARARARREGERESVWRRIADKRGRWRTRVRAARVARCGRAAGAQRGCGRRAGQRAREAAALRTSCFATALTPQRMGVCAKRGVRNADAPQRRQS